MVVTTHSVWRMLLIIPFLACAAGTASPDRPVAGVPIATTSHVHAGLHSASIRSISWRPKGRELATASDDGGVRIWSVDLEQRVLELVQQPVRPGDPAAEREIEWGDDPVPVSVCTWSTNGEHLAYGTAGGVVGVWDRRLGRHSQKVLISRTSGLWRWVSALSWEPDGKRLVVGRYQGKAQVRDGLNGTLLMEFIGLNDIAWSPNGEYFADGSVLGHVRLLDSRDGREVVRLQSNLKGRSGGQSYRVRWSPDSTLLAAQDAVGHDVLVWEVATRRPLVRLAGFDVIPRGLAWSPNGRMLAVTTSKTLTCWRIPQGRKVAVAPLPSGTDGAVDWAPDGRTIAVGGADGCLQMIRLTD